MSENIVITYIIVGAACALVEAFLGAVLSAPQPNDIKPIDPSWAVYQEKRHLEFKVHTLEAENNRLRAEIYRYCVMNHAWQHCCPNCYSERTHVVYAKTPKEQEVVDLIRKTTVPFDQLKKKFGL